MSTLRAPAFRAHTDPMHDESLAGESLAGESLAGESMAARFDGGRARDRADIVAGLTAPRKTLPARLFYDERGCALFGEITQLDEYYLTRAEHALLAQHADSLVATVPSASVLVEYGASDEGKALVLLRAARPRLSAYVPIDIAPGALKSLQVRLRDTEPALDVFPLAADFHAALSLPRVLGGRHRIGFFPGSTIGNFEPAVAVRFLRQVLATLSAGADADRVQLIVGTDLRKDPSRLIPAYDDKSGVTAAFNRNILSHVNRIADADLDPDLFAHRALWNEAEGRMEMHLVSRRPQVATVADRRIAFAADETIHTESSYKHTPESFLRLAAEAGWQPDGFWTDERGLFGMHRLVAAPAAA